ncbi:hypothetical protein F4818DRAFT_455728 [Hypoxylon cercidicola]|nr:hypothetical protein F4818DRAFT_455728 [Hypoxylon cercidicola]
MENTQATQQVPKLREVAKKLADGRRQHKDKYRRLKHLVYNNYKPSNVDSAIRANYPSPPSSSPPGNPTDVAGLALDDPVWNMPACQNGHPQSNDLKLETMLRVADDCYKFAAHDFDTMDLYQHMEYILKDMSERGVLRCKVSDALVTRDLIQAAQQRKESAEKDFGSFVAKQAALANLPEQLQASYKKCQNCGERFRFERSPNAWSHPKQPWVHHGECHYHPGAIRSWNDELLEEGQPLKEHFLTMGNVKMSEFACIIQACYWDCCGAKLVEPEPNAAARGKRFKHKHLTLSQWEIRNENDGVVGCQVLKDHVAFE